MGRVLLLAVAAALYPQLLAVVVVILTRPDPRPLLWACYLGSLLTGIVGGIVIFAVFRSKGTILGASAHRLSPAAYLVIGAIALALAIAAATSRGRELMGRDFPVLRRRNAREPVESNAESARSKAEQALSEGSVAVAGVVGVVLAAPGPFDLLALGHLARGDYEFVLACLGIVAFVLIKFVLIEIPIVSYAIHPASTAARVSRFAGWMTANKMVVGAAAIGVIGVVLIGRGISGLA